MLGWTLLLVACVAGVLRILAWRFDLRIAADAAVVQSIPASSREPTRPPRLLASYFERTGLMQCPRTRWCRIEQVGEMRLTPDQDWKSFRAVQVYAVADPSFVWSATFGSIRVVDCVIQGRGHLEARMHGVVPLAKTSGASATRAQMLRYLAEIAWVPAAILRNPFLSWAQLNERQVLGSIDRDDVHVELKFSFDSSGDIRRVEGMRERSVGSREVLTPWVGVFSEYGIVDGVRVPTKGSVEWLLDSGPFPCWRGTVVRMQIDEHGDRDA